MPTSGRSRVPLVDYSAWLVVIVAASFLFANTGFSIYASLPDPLRRARWMGVVLNVIVPVLAGLLSGAVALRILSARGQLRTTLRDHFFRTAPWYLLICLLVWVIVRNAGIRDFGLWSQIITWPLYSTIGALVVDIFWSWRIFRMRASGSIGA